MLGYSPRSKVNCVSPVVQITQSVGRSTRGLPMQVCFQRRPASSRGRSDVEGDRLVYEREGGVYIFGVDGIERKMQNLARIVRAQADWE